MQQRRRIYSSLALWSEKRRAGAQAEAVVRENFARRTGAAGHQRPSATGNSGTGSIRDAA